MQLLLTVMVKPWLGPRGYDAKARATLVIFLKTLNQNLCSNFLTQPPDPDLQVM